jgi:hypothetical protein
VNSVIKETGRTAILPQHETLLIEANKSDRREVVGQLIKMLEEGRRLAYKNGQPALAVTINC